MKILQTNLYYDTKEKLIVIQNNAQKDQDSGHIFQSTIFLDFEMAKLWVDGITKILAENAMP